MFRAEVVLECYRTFAVDFNTVRPPVFVTHKSLFEDESIVFRHGMAALFSIENKILVADGDLVAVDKMIFFYQLWTNRCLKMRLILQCSVDLFLLLTNNMTCIIFAI